MAMILPPIHAEPPRSSILTAARRIPGSEAWDRWPDAITWTPDCPGDAGTFPACRRTEDCVTGDDFTEDDKAGSEPGFSPYFVPFWVYAGSRCDTFGSLTLRDHMDRAERILNAQLPAEVGNVLWTGEVNGAQVCYTIAGETFLVPSLATAAQFSTVGPPYEASAIAAVLTGLIEDMEACGQYDITFHIPSKLKPLFVEANHVTRVGDRWVAFGEYPVAFGPGYPGTPPLDLTDILGEDFSVSPDALPEQIDDPDSTSAWVYASGPVEYAVSEFTMFRGVNVDGGTTFGSRDDFLSDDAERAFMNYVEVIAEKMVVLRFDTCCVRAALALACPTCTEPDS